jgi:hypothetical protein
VACDMCHATHPLYRSKSMTISQCGVCGNMSTATARTARNPLPFSFFVAGRIKLHRITHHHTHHSVRKQLLHCTQTRAHVPFDVFDE